MLDKEALIELIVHYIRDIHIRENLLSPPLYEVIPYACQIYIGFILLNIMLESRVK